MSTVLLSAPYMIPEIKRFEPVFTHFGLEVIQPKVNERLSEEELLAYAGQFDAAICGDDRFSEQVLQACSPRLKVISKWGTGIDSIDRQAAARLGIQVFNTNQVPLAKDRSKVFDQDFSIGRTNSHRHQVANVTKDWLADIVFKLGDKLVSNG